MTIDKPGRVVALVDARLRSERSVGVAVQIAARTNRPLTLLTANASPFSFAMLDRHKALIAQHPGVQAESILAESAGAESTVLMRCLKDDDIVVVAADHVSIAGELLEGSVFMNLLRLFPGVIVAIGPKAVMPDASWVMLVCIDDDSNEPLRLLTDFADVASLTPELVEVVPTQVRHQRPLNDSGNDLGSDVIDSGELHQLAARWNEARPNALRASWDVLHGDAVAAIEAHADDPRVAAIGLVSLAFRPIARIISPSLANNLLHRSPRPLVLLSEPPKQVIHQCR